MFKHGTYLAAGMALALCCAADVAQGAVIWKDQGRHVSCWASYANTYPVSPIFASDEREAEASGWEEFDVDYVLTPGGPGAGYAQAKQHSWFSDTQVYASGRAVARVDGGNYTWMRGEAKSYFGVSFEVTCPTEYRIVATGEGYGTMEGGSKLFVFDGEPWPCVSSMQGVFEPGHHGLEIEIFSLGAVLSYDFLMTLTPLPEPSSGLLAAGAGAMALLRRRRAET